MNSSLATSPIRALSARKNTICTTMSYVLNIAYFACFYRWVESSFSPCEYVSICVVYIIVWCYGDSYYLVAWCGLA